MKKWMIVIALLALAGWAIVNNTVLKKDKPVETNVASDVKIGTEIDEAAPNFRLRTLDGKEVSLSDYRGKTVILNFWATWCPPCRAEMPDMERLYKDINKKDVEILAVNATSSERSIEAVKTFISDNRFTFPVLLDEEGSVNALYRITSIPTSYVLDPKGIIRIKHIGPMSYDNMKEYVNEMK
ncbi:MAG: peroxiredoxin family protein [Ectobacillus sp.]